MKRRILNLSEDEFKVLGAVFKRALSYVETNYHIAHKIGISVEDFDEITTAILKRLNK